MSVFILPADRGKTKELILSMNGGILTDDELRALDGCTSPTAHLWIGYINDTAVCAWGLVPPTMLSDSAYLWLYSTDAVDEYKFLFVRHSQLIMEELKTMYPLIHGVCRISQPKSIKWLQWLGARFGDPGPELIPFTIGGLRG